MVMRWRVEPIVLFVAVQAIWIGSKSVIRTRCYLSSYDEDALTEAACGNLADAESFSGVPVT